VNSRPNWTTLYPTPAIHAIPAIPACNTCLQYLLAIPACNTCLQYLQYLQYSVYTTHQPTHDAQSALEQRFSLSYSNYCYYQLLLVFAPLMFCSAAPTFLFLSSTTQASALVPKPSRRNISSQSLETISTSCYSPRDAFPPLHPNNTSLWRPFQHIRPLVACCWPIMCLLIPIYL
jgi:hypothetical protein